MTSWKCSLENRADLCVDECQKLSEYRVSLTEGKKEKSQFLTACGSVEIKTAVLDGMAMSSGSISRVVNDDEA